MSIPISRRKFLTWGAGIFGGLVTGKWLWETMRPTPSYAGRLLHGTMGLGHQIRDGGVFPEPSQTRALDIVIVGGGLAGLSAAWHLKHHGHSDFKLLELESVMGGNARSDRNAVSAYPWGAHYVPLPNPESTDVRRLFEELGVIRGTTADGLPLYEERYLCHEPEERLFKDGTWQEGLIPQRGLQPVETAEIAAFMAKMETFRQALDRDGRPAFAIPLAYSSQDPHWLALDRISMAQWLLQEGFQTTPLRWYVNYCCRDDYGGTLETTSAWAGIHYFAGRRGQAANAEPNTVLTWPEGNGWLVRQLADRLTGHLISHAAVFRVTPQDIGATVDYWDAGLKTTIRIQARHVILAVPRFVAWRLLPTQTMPHGIRRDDLHYTPWVVANLTVRRRPAGRGLPMAWDNVSYTSPSLGYIVATHQAIETYPGRTVLTYYRPLTDTSPQEARIRARHKTHAQWARLIMADLEAMHPGLGHDVETMDVHVWGHGMIRPSPGFLWGSTRQAMHATLGAIVFAHSDMSGMSNFEEAQYQGLRAADHVLRSGRGA